MKQVLVIKLGALGDMFAATSAFEAIHNHHATDHITLLTTSPYENLAKQVGYFDDIWFDDRVKLTHPRKVWNLRKKLRAKGFDRVYDLQMVDRTNFYYHLMGPG